MCLHTGLLQQPCEALRSYATCLRPPLSKGWYPDVSPGGLAGQQLLPAMATCHFQQAGSSLPQPQAGLFLAPWTWHPARGPAQGKVRKPDLPEQGLRSGFAPASLGRWCPGSSALSTSSVTAEARPPGRPLEGQGAATLTVGAAISGGRPCSLSQEARKKRRFYSESCPRDVGWGGAGGEPGPPGVHTVHTPLPLPLHGPQERGYSPTHC